MPQLDSLAADVINLGTIPEGGRLIVLASSNGWPGPVGGISVTDGSMNFSGDGFSSSDTLWGYCEEDGRGVLVTAPTPPCIPEGLPFGMQPGGSASFRLIGGWVKAVFLASPSGEIMELRAGEDSCFIFATAETGVYWIEAMADRGRGPEVLMLLPVLSGVELMDVMTGLVGIPGSNASSMDDLLLELNSSRTARGLSPLSRDGGLDEVAGQRARRVAISGSILHPGSLEEEVDGSHAFLAENIGRGSGLDEAWSMILTSPAHLMTCLGSEYDSIGMAAAVEIERDGWQFILIQIFSGE